MPYCRSIAALVAFACAAPLAGGTALVVPAAVLAAIPDDDAVRLPRGAAPWETGREVSPTVLAAPPPVGSVHTAPEYAKNLGLLLRWGSFNAELTAITVAVTTGDPEARIWLVVSGAVQQASAAATLTGAGADLSRVEFLTIPSNSVWIRDYGPRFIEEDGRPAIVDHVYNRPRPLDDVLPVAVATALSEPRFDLPLVHGGGNFHLFGDGRAFMTELVLDENGTLEQSEIEQLYAAYQNLDLTIWPGFPTSYDSTRHIDMWFLPVRDRVAIVGQYALATGAPYTITEAAVTELTGLGYSILRTPGWRSGGTHYTYANAVILNKLVLVPQYSGYPTQNQQALAVFAEAFPGRQIVPIDGSNVVQSAGVFHCIVMHVPDPDFLFWDDFETADLSTWSSAAL